MRQVYGARNVTGEKLFRTPHIEQHEPWLGRRERGVNVPAVRFESEQSFKVRKGSRGIRGRYLGDMRAVHRIRHVSPPDRSVYPEERDFERQE